MLIQLTRDACLTLSVRRSQVQSFEIVTAAPHSLRTASTEIREFEKLMMSCKAFWDCIVALYPGFLICWGLAGSQPISVDFGNETQFVSSSQLSCQLVDHTDDQQNRFKWYSDLLHAQFSYEMKVSVSVMSLADVC